MQRCWGDSEVAGPYAVPSMDIARPGRSPRRRSARPARRVLTAAVLGVCWSAAKGTGARGRPRRGRLAGRSTCSRRRLVAATTRPRPLAEVWSLCGAFGHGHALRALAAGDGDAYAHAIAAIEADFAAREEHLTGVAIADTAVMLELIAAERGLAAKLASPLVPTP